MNTIYRSIWNGKTGTFVAVSENAKAAGKKSSRSASAAGVTSRLCLKALSVSVMLAFGANVYALPAGGVVAEGGATINSGASTTTINQSTQNTVINWQSFNIAQGQTVQFVQPNAGSVALNRVVGANPSSILGNLSANGKVFLVNPNGILFGQGASVNVAGLVASTLNITDSNFMAANYKFDSAGAGTVLNQGTINAEGGYVALLGANVSNQGVISANLGTVALAAGNAVTLDVAGDGLLNVVVNQGAVNALVENGGLIKADGGRVLMTTQAAGNLLQTVVNNTGVIQAQTIENRNGTILLLGDMQSGTVNVGGTLDASAPNGGNGGFIETSAARVKIHEGVHVTTASALGQTGNWLIDPEDFTIGGGATDNISGATLSALLVTNSVTITTAPGSNATVAGTPPVTSLYTATAGNGDINVNQAVSWTASSNPTTLTLNAVRDVNVNAAVSATNGNFVVCCGRDVNVNAPITTVNGSILLSAGRNVNQNAATTTTDGNITMCAAQDVNVNAQITLTRGSSIPAQSLGLPLGLVLSAGYGGTGPGVAGGTVVFAPLAPAAVVTGPSAPVTINYNPISYTTPTDYSSKFTLTGGSTLTQHMLVFPEGSKTFDGTTIATFSSLKGNPAGVTLVAGPGSTATFDTADVGTGKTVTFSGYSLTGVNANQYALAVSCCGPVVARTTANITPAIVVAPPIAPPSIVASPSYEFDTPIPPSTDGSYTPQPSAALLKAPVVALAVVLADTPKVAVAEEIPAATTEATTVVPTPAEVPPKPVPKRQPKQDRS